MHATAIYSPIGTPNMVEAGDQAPNRHLFSIIVLLNPSFDLEGSSSARSRRAVYGPSSSTVPCGAAIGPVKNNRDG